MVLDDVLARAVARSTGSAAHIHQRAGRYGNSLTLFVRVMCEVYLTRCMLHERGLGASACASPTVHESGYLRGRGCRLLLFFAKARRLRVALWVSVGTLLAYYVFYWMLPGMLLEYWVHVNLYVLIPGSVALHLMSLMRSADLV